MARSGVGHQIAARLILAVAIGALAGVLYHRSAVANFERSQTITLEEYTAGFDEYRANLASEQYPLWGTVALMVLVMLIVFGSYELVAAGIGWALAAVVPARSPPAPDETPTDSFHTPPATSRFHSNLGRFAIGGGVVVVAFLAVAVLLQYRTYEVPEDTDIFSVLEGFWAWGGSDSACAADPHAISFSPDREQMYIAHAEPFEGADGTLDSVTRYDILEVTRGHIRGAIPGEQRLTENGEPVVWDLVLRGPDRYAWRRTDLAYPFAFSRDVVKCTPPRSEP